MTIIEKLGQFFLGRIHDPEGGRTSQEELHYDAKDLTTHAVCVGMTGSGKTGLCLSLLEEAALDGIPAICIDPKGDLGNLILTFPGLTPAEFQPWVDPAAAARQGMTVEQYATKTADTWQQKLAQWGQSAERVRNLRDAAEVAIYTPASNAGRPITVLRALTAPSADILNDTEALRERIMAAVSGLLALLQIDADPISSREYILLSSILEASWLQGNDVEMGMLIRLIQEPPFDKVGFLDLESFYPASDRFKLAMLLNNMLSSPGFAGWLEGEALDIPKLFYTPAGKPRLAVISIAHLSDQERMFFVTILLNEVIAWMRSQPGTASLRAILYMDEVFGYFPPTANPPSKQPMLTLLKQARAYGLGCVLATQNPVDIDYKGLSNAGTWFLGRLQTERDKMRVLEGLEGAAASAGSSFDKQRTEQILAGLDSRVFLMNNVHEDQPVVFKTRWALSYLRGPLSREQIRILMDPLKEKSDRDSRATFALTNANESAKNTSRPVLPPGIPELFFSVRASAGHLVYRPALLGAAKVHFVAARDDVDRWEEVVLLALTGDDIPPDFWHQADEWGEDELPELTDECKENAAFGDLAAALTQKKSYAKWKSELKDFLYQNRRLPIWKCPALDEASASDESESDFRIRLRHSAREERDRQLEKLRAKYASRIRTLDDRMRRARQKVEREKSQRSRKTMSAGLSVMESIAGALFGRKLRSVTNVSRANAAIRRAGSVAKESEDVQHAEEAVEALMERHQELNAQIEEEVHRIQDRFDPDLMQLTEKEIKPRKSDISVERLILVWLPYDVDDAGNAERAF
jgi:hypothetical protein